MRAWMLGLLLVLAVLAVGIAILGCSGAGTTPAQVAGGPVQALATDNLSAYVLVSSWASILYPPPAGAGQCEEVINPPKTLPDGSTEVTGTLTDCGAFDRIETKDKSGHESIKWPNGTSDYTSWSAPVHNGNKVTQQLDEMTPRGAHLKYASIITYGAPGTPRLYQGTVTLPDLKIMRFAWKRTNEVADHVTLDLPDGSALEFRVPLVRRNYQANQPGYTRGAQGSFTDAAGATLKFQLTATGNKWTQWQFTTPGGAAGSFSLANGLSGGGAGQLTQGGRMVGSLNWLAGGAGSLSLLGTGAWQVTPSAAAIDFETDRWLGNTALLGPAPEY